MIKPLKVPILSNIPIMPDVYLLWVKADIPFEPGQFFMLRCGEGILLRRPLSAHKKEEGKISFLYKVVGKGTSLLRERKPEEILDLIGPLGNSFSISPGSKSILLIAGGLGIAPLIPLAERAMKMGYHVILLLGAKSKEKIYPFLPKEVEIYIATEDGSMGYKGLVSDLLALPLKFDQAFASGPLNMYKALYNSPYLKDKEVQITLEVRMGCGFGACFGCSIPTIKGQRLVCCDGPVFDLREVIWKGVRL